MIFSSVSIATMVTPAAAGMSHFIPEYHFFTPVGFQLMGENALS